MKKEISSLLEEIVKLHKKSKQEKYSNSMEGSYIHTNLSNRKEQLKTTLQKFTSNWQQVFDGLLEQAGVIDHEPKSSAHTRAAYLAQERERKKTEELEALAKKRQQLQQWQQQNKPKKLASRFNPCMETFEND